MLAYVIQAHILLAKFIKYLTMCEDLPLGFNTSRDPGNAGSAPIVFVLLLRADKEVLKNEIRSKIENGWRTSQEIYLSNVSVKGTGCRRIGKGLTGLVKNFCKDSEEQGSYVSFCGWRIKYTKKQGHGRVNQHEGPWQERWGTVLGA